MQEHSGTFRKVSELLKAEGSFRNPSKLFCTFETFKEHKSTIQSPAEVLLSVSRKKKLLALLGVHSKFQKPVRTVTCPLEPLGIHQVSRHKLETSTKPLDI